MRIFSTILVIATTATALQSASVLYEASSESYTMVPGIDKSGAAFGSYNATCNITGWGVLDIVADSALDYDGNGTDFEHAYFAAGYLEAGLTCNEIAIFSQNNDDARQDKPEADWLAENMKFVRAQAASNTSDYWVAAKRVLLQFNGIVAGYKAECSEKNEGLYPTLTEEQLYWMQADGDLIDLQNALDPSPMRMGRRSRKRVANGLPPGQRCSSLIKLLPDNSDMFFGHATWDDYSNMAPRIFKTYSLPVQRDGKNIAHLVTFAG
jgi:hypothetical protein